MWLKELKHGMDGRTKILLVNCRHGRLSKRNYL